MSKWTVSMKVSNENSHFASIIGTLTCDFSKNSFLNRIQTSVETIDPCKRAF